MKGNAYDQRGERQTRGSLKDNQGGHYEGQRNREANRRGKGDSDRPWRETVLKERQYIKRKTGGPGIEFKRKGKGGQKRTALGGFNK